MGFLKKEISLSLGQYNDKKWLILSLDNPGHNILELYIFGTFCLVNKLGIWVASWVADRLKV